MDINATLIGQMITFALFVWFTMRFIWPLLDKVLQERQQKISEGLAAAERGHQELEIAQKYAIQHIHEARSKALDLIEQAKKQADQMLDQAKAMAEQERKQIILLAHAEIEQERNSVKEALKKEVVSLAVVTAEKLLNRVITEQDQIALLQQGAREN